MFQTLAPGESVIASVNAARTHKLAGIQTAQISAIQGFKYVTGATAPDSTKDMAFCGATSSKSLTITPDQRKVAGYVPHRRFGVTFPY
jgi:deuterolysin